MAFDFLSCKIKSNRIQILDFYLIFKFMRRHFNEIVYIKKTNPSLFYNTIIDMVIKEHFKSDILLNKIFDNSLDSKIGDNFFNIYITDDAISEFFQHTAAISDFLRDLGEPNLTSYFNSTIETIVSAVVGNNSIK